MIKQDKKRFFKAAMIFFIWLIAVFYIGSHINQKMATKAKQPVIESSVDATGSNVAEEDRTPEQKENIEKLNIINERAVKNDLSNISDSLGLNEGWEMLGEATEKGVPILRPYFPKGQNQNAWREALVFRSFVNVKMKNPIPTVYEVYDTWLKNQLPDIQLKQTENNNSGITFSGYSASGKVFIAGKIFTGSLDTSIYIVQYIIKNDGKDDVEKKAQKWNFILNKIQ